MPWKGSRSGGAEDLLEGLARLRRAATAATDAGELAQVVATELGWQLDAPAVLVAGVREGAVHCLAGQGFASALLETFPLPLDAPDPVAEVARTGSELRLAGHDELTDRFPTWRTSGALSLAVLPARRLDGVVGAIAVGRFREAPFTDDDLEVGGGVAEVLADALVRLPVARLTEHHRAALVPAQDEALLRTVLRSISDGLGGDVIMLIVPTAEPGIYDPAVIVDRNPAAAAWVPLIEGRPQPGAGGQTEQVMRTGAPVFSPHLDPVLGPTAGVGGEWFQYFAELPVRALMRVPVVVDGHIVAVLGAHRRGPMPYTVADLDYLQASAQRLGGAWGQELVLRSGGRSPAPRPHEPSTAADASSLLLRLIGGAPFGVAAFDAGGRVRHINARFESMLGIPASTALDRATTDALAPVGPAFAEILERVLVTREPVREHDLVVERPDLGIERHWRASCFPFDGPMADVAAIATFVDVSDETLAVRRSERLLALAAVLAAVDDGDHLAAELATFLADTFGGHAAVGLVEGDEIRVAAMAGYEEEFADRWRQARVPLDARTPMTDAVRSAQSVEVRSASEFQSAWVGLESERTAAREASLSVHPLFASPHRRRVVAVAHLGWAQQRLLTDHSRLLLQTALAMAGLAHSRLELRREVQDDRFRTALDAMLDDVVLTSAVRDVDGRIVDFVVEYLNPAMAQRHGRPREELAGRRLLDLFPAAAEHGLMARYVRCVETGESFQLQRMEYHDVAPDGRRMDGFWDLQVVRSGDGCLIAASDVTSVVLAERAAAEQQRLRERDRMSVDLLQRAALPLSLPEHRGVRLGALYQPVAHDQPIGGDWYDVVPLRRDRLGLVIADVAGHGHEAATTMVQVRNVLRALAVEHQEPSRVLERTNQIATRLHHSDGLFVTCCYALLDTATGTLSWARAGHLDPIVVRDGRTPWYPDSPGGPPIGARVDTTFRVTSTTVRPGDRIVLFTDGLVERHHESIDVGLARLRDEIGRHAKVGPQALAASLVASVPDQFDDIAVLCVDIAPP